MGGTMRAVVQEETTGCGLACVAMLAGRDYSAVREAAAAMGIHASDEALWSDTAHVRRLLDHFGVPAAPDESPFRGWDTLPDRALLAIKHHWEGDRAYWHWAVFVREPDGAAVLDPAAHLDGEPRTDWAGMEPAWSIAVTPASPEAGG